MARTDLPPLPRISLVELEDLTIPAQSGFLRLRRRVLALRREDGTLSEPFTFDNVDRVALDAVVMAAHFRGSDGQLRIYLRSALRPAARLRPLDRRPLPERETLGALWELPAGLVEPDESSPEGLLRCAARELSEELGFVVSPAELSPLGPATFPAAGIIGERHHFFQVEVDPERRRQPTEDGSVLEQGALIIAVPLAAALAQARAGELEDAKTELGLRRLADLYEPCR